MNNIDLVKAINTYSFSGEINKIVEILNDLFDNEEYKNVLSLVFIMISMTEMYGFLAYLNNEELEKFLEWDKFRSKSYSGQRMDYYNSGQLSLLMDFEKYKKVFFSAPTSFGKTSLILEYIIMNFSKLKNILFIVPTNSLLEELYIKVAKIKRDYNLNYEISTQPKYQDRKNNFLIITPERFLLLYEDRDINMFDLIVMDETYKIVDSRNQSITDFIESRALRFRKVADIIGESQNALFLLSPFTYNLTESMKEYLDRHNIVKIDRKIEYVKRNIIQMYNSKKFKEYFKTNIVGYTTDSSISNKVNLLLNQLKDDKNIVYVAKYVKAYEIIDSLEWQREHIENDRFSKFLKHLEKNYSVDEKREWKIITALKKGVGIYISPLPRYIKKEIINLYEKDILGTLIVTTSFTEGVNTNASNLIFTSLVNGPNSNMLSDIDVLNVSGRAGRFAKKSIGKIYCITEEVFNKVYELQNNSQIKLENYNYKENHFGQRIDFELDMIEDEYLNEEEIKLKEQTKKDANELGLSLLDLRISLNVSTKWKIALYRYFLENSQEIEKAYNASINLLKEQSNKRISALNTIFAILKKSFENAEIDGFKSEAYDIRAFDSHGQFIWGRLYQVFCSGSISKVISNNIKFISKQYSSVINKYSLFNYGKKNEIEGFFYQESLGWVLKYYYNDLSMNFDAFYSETFKFISNIIQYKIPFYTSYFVSILKLFISKKGLTDTYDINSLDVKKIAMLFEDGSIYDDYSKMLDFGISNDLIMKLHDNKITIQNLKENEYNQEVFDEYELLLINDFLKID